MGISERFRIAFAKSQLAAGTVLPDRGQDLRQRQPSGTRTHVVDLARRLVALGYEIVATEGTGQRLEEAGIRGARA